ALQHSHGREGRPAGHHRSSRGPSIAPARVHRVIVPPYQSATKGSESSMQWNAYAVALTLPATRPARARARPRSGGAIARTARMITANGTTAMIGIDSRHSSHWSPTIILSQCVLGADARLIV